MNPLLNVESLFTERYGAPGITVRAPGRVNLIGEHVDYNDGFVLPMALSLQTVLRFRPRADDKVHLFAAGLNQQAEFSLTHIFKQNSWIDYVAGVAQQLQRRGFTLRGFEGVIDSSIPMASGLSSSAAIEVATALAFLNMVGGVLPADEVALLCQRAENEFLGVNCGIMDQMAVAACQEDHALLLDCRSLEMRQVPFVLKDHCIIVTDSAAPRELAASAYNERRAQCEQGLAILKTVLPGVRSLRDVSEADLNKHAALLPAYVVDRVRHVVEEIARTQFAVAALERGDLEIFGIAMNASHRSLADLYQVSSPELDWLTSWAQSQPGVLGSRLTGAGFGGCTVSLVANAHANGFIERLPVEYLAAMERHARCWVCRPAAGASVL